MRISERLAHLDVLFERLDGFEEISLPLLQGGHVLLLILHLPSHALTPVSHQGIDRQRRRWYDDGAVKMAKQGSHRGIIDRTLELSAFVRSFIPLVYGTKANRRHKHKSVGGDQGLSATATMSIARQAHLIQ